MRALGLATVIAALALAPGCASVDFTREGATEAQFLNDEALCRAQVRRMTRDDRAIADQREEMGRSDGQRFGQTTLREQMSATGDRSRTAKLMESCMTARGWTPKAPWWQRLGS